MPLLEKQGDNYSDDDVLIAVMGLTGAGKSTFINVATQSSNKLKVGHSIQSCTDAIARADPFELDGRRVVLFDTPGFDDTNKSETEILRIIAFELEKQYRKGKTLHGIVYVHRITDQRVGGVAKTNFRIFRKLCGDSSLKNVLIMTNMWSRLESELEGQRRAAELASLDDFFKPAISQGALMVHHKKGTVESAHRILRQILKNHPLALSIQKEIVDQRKTITQTGAGIAVDEKIALLAQEYERRLKEQLEAAEEARRERDEQSRKEQLEEAQKVRQLLRKLEEEKRSQVRQYERLQEQFAEAERKREQAVREAEERSRQLRWEMELAERRKAREAEEAEERNRALRQELEANLERKMQKMTLASEFGSPPSHGTVSGHSSASPPTQGIIVSGHSYEMLPMQHQSSYLALDMNEEDIILTSGVFHRASARHVWKFVHVPNELDDNHMLWKIQSARNGKYLCATQRCGLHALRTLSPTLWCTWMINSNNSLFEIDRHDENKLDDESVILVKAGRRGNLVGWSALDDEPHAYGENNQRMPVECGTWVLKHVN